MCSVFSRGGAAAAIAFLAIVIVPARQRAAASPDAPPLRVCADPNNMPFSNQRAEGFENRIADLVGRELARRVDYLWQPQRRGFIRTTLSAGHCDLIMGVPASFELVLATRPYYRSTYVFVSRRRDQPVASFDDPRLKRWRIGIQLTGDDYDNPPAAQALARRRLFNQVRGFMVYGDYSREAPERDVIDAVVDGRVDVAAVWGPIAGYFAAHEPKPLVVTPTPATDTLTRLPFTFAIAMGVRRDNPSLREQLNGIIVRRHGEIARILQEYHVPLVESSS